MRSHVFVAIGISAALGAGGLGIEACSSGSNSPNSSNPEGGSGATSCTTALSITFSPMYSAYDGTHMFQIPAVVNANSNVNWTASDMTAVGFQPNADLSVGGYNGVTITVLKAAASPVTVTAQSGTQCGSSVLNITAAMPSDWDIGNARYNNGQSLHLPTFGGAEGGMPPMVQVDGGSFFETPGTPPPACTNCHGPTATDKLFKDVAHTPEQTGGFSDSDLLNIILNGEVPDGGYFNPNIVSPSMWHSFHQWTDITADQQKGIIVYLRSIPPASESGSVNLGGFGPSDAGTGSE
jgi:hypothetical protein